jgi:hypothetical protein
MRITVNRENLEQIGKEAQYLATHDECAKFRELSFKVYQKAMCMDVWVTGEFSLPHADHGIRVRMSFVYTLVLEDVGNDLEDGWSATFTESQKGLKTFLEYVSEDTNTGSEDIGMALIDAPAGAKALRIGQNLDIINKASFGRPSLKGKHTSIQDWPSAEGVTAYVQIPTDQWEIDPGQDHIVDNEDNQALILNLLKRLRRGEPDMKARRKSTQTASPGESKEIVDDDLSALPFPLDYRPPEESKEEDIINEETPEEISEENILIPAAEDNTPEETLKEISEEVSMGDPINMTPLTKKDIIKTLQDIAVKQQQQDTEMWIHLRQTGKKIQDALESYQALCTKLAQYKTNDELCSAIKDLEGVSEGIPLEDLHTLLEQYK